MRSSVVMRKNLNTKNIDWFIVLYVIAHYYVDNVYFFLFSCLLLAYYLLPNLKIKMPMYIKSSRCIIIILALGSIMGFVHINSYGMYKIIRDLFYVLNPILFVMISFNYKNESKYDLLKTVAIAAVIFSTIHIVTVGCEITVSGGNISTLRSLAGKGELIEVIGAVLFFSKNNELVAYKFSRNFSLFAFCICLISVVLSFSRTYIVMLLIMIYCVLFLGQKKINKVVKNFFSIGVVLITIIFVANLVMPSMTTAVFLKFQRSLTEIGSNSNWNDKSNIIQNWRGYEVYCAQQQYKAASFIQQIFGQGFGKIINTYGYERLVSNESGGVTILHNGFYTVLIKCGFVGLLSYILFFARNIFYWYKRRYSNYESRFMLGLYLAILFSTPFIVGLFRGSSFLEACLLVAPLTKQEKKESL